MHLRRLFIGRIALAATLLAASSVNASAIEILDNVPQNALGFVLVQDFEGIDVRTSQLLKEVELEFLGPLALLRATTGIGEGLDPGGDILIVALPGPTANDRPSFAVWLTVDDYPQFLTSLRGAATDRITAITVAGEDLLVAQHGNWVLLMDPTERTRMEQLLSAVPNERSGFNKWPAWVRANDVTAAILPGGVRAIASWAMTSQGAEAEDDLFDFGGERDKPARQPIEGVADANNISATARARIRQWIREMPRAMVWAIHTDAIACGVRLDDAGNAVAGARLSWRSGPRVGIKAAAIAAAESQAPKLFQGGDFILSGGGSFPEEFSVEAAGVYARWLVRGLEQDTRTKLDARTANQFIEAMKVAANGIQSISVLTRSGDEKDGVYTNSFSAVHVQSADRFIERARDVMRTWNELNYDLQGEMKLVFDSETTQIDGRDAFEYSIDMAAAMGAPGLPEVRQAMEKLFGAEGKLRLVFCPVDNETVLMATGTVDQTKAVLATLARRAKPSDDWPEFEPANHLLPEQPGWRLFASPHGYTSWLRRQMDAVLGPVLGGPVVKEFPASPPLGIAGGFADHEAWIDVAAPVATIKGAATYLKK